MRFRFVPPHIHAPRSVQNCEMFRIRRGTVRFWTHGIHICPPASDPYVFFRTFSASQPASAVGGQPASQRRRWLPRVPQRCRDGAATVPHDGAARCRTVPHDGAARCRTVPRRTEKHHSYTVKRSILLTVPHGAATFVKRKSIFIFSFLSRHRAAP